jgi:hypothetical protein
MRDLWTRYRAQILALLAAIVASVSVVVVVSDDNHDGRPDHVTVTIAQKPATAPEAVTVDGPDADTKRDDSIPLDKDAQAVVQDATKAPEKYDLGGGLRGQDDTPAGVLTGPLAAQEWPGCRTAFVHSFSQRKSPVEAISLHYTAGLNLAGWSDLLGLTAYSNILKNEVSWHFGIDREGNCIYNVPTRYKAWTIGNLNSQTVNIEVVGTGRESDYAGKGIAKVRAVVQRIGRLYGIPMRLGATDGHCNVTRTGIITHWMGGPCSGGHIDIKPYSITRVVAAMAKPAKPKVSSSSSVLCRKINWWRHARERGQALRNANLRVAELKTRGLVCTTSGVTAA